MKDGRPFTFAGLWENWKDPQTDEWLRTCTIITGEPNELVAQIHPRGLVRSNFLPTHEARRFPRNGARLRRINLRKAKKTYLLNFKFHV
jgi:hypothetical protein